MSLLGLIMNERRHHRSHSLRLGAFLLLCCCVAYRSKGYISNCFRLWQQVRGYEMHDICAHGMITRLLLEYQDNFLSPQQYLRIYPNVPTLSILTSLFDITRAGFSHMALLIAYHFTHISSYPVLFGQRPTFQTQ
jgi:uncharacterized membrane protein SirB2